MSETPSNDPIMEQIEAKKKRAERFGLEVPELTEEEKKALRAQRFGTTAKSDLDAKIDGMFRSVLSRCIAALSLMAVSFLHSSSSDCEAQA
jgi:hypothetical protein